MKKEARREFLKTTVLFTAGSLLPFHFTGCRKNPPVFLIVSGWQTANIGDITHTPGMIRLIYAHFPDARCILWPKNIDKEVEDLLIGNFPGLRLVYFDPSGDSDQGRRDIDLAIEEADMLIHSSGPGIIGREQVKYWMDNTDKPYGIFGVTVSGVWDEIRPILSGSKFIFTRETKSLEVLNEEAINHPEKGFAPDSTFFIQLSNETKAERFLKTHDLREKEYICVIPRLRYTPYHEIYPDIGWSEEKIREVIETNNKYKETDHEKMVEVMTWWVRETGMKVLICPEMTYQVDIMDPLLVDPLPDDVRNKVVKHEYWLPDEAASIYKRAHTVISMECHSPIIAAANGTPCFYLRQPQDTIKGQMWYDIGLEDWVFEIEETTGMEIISELESVHNNYLDAENYLQKAMRTVNTHYEQALLTIGRQLP